MSESNEPTTDLRFEPWGNRLVVRPHNPVEKIGGILMPQQALERPVSGDLLAVGPDCSRYFEDHVGNIVLFASGSGTVTLVDDQQFLIINPEEILGCLPAGTPAPAAEI